MKSQSQDIPLKEDYLPFLDGLRGLAAVWVIASHSLLLTGASMRIPILNRGDIAVQLFMIMSGFLMTYHYYARQAKEPWEKPKTWWRFYIRRFFRIAPLYYVLFLMYQAMGPTIGSWRQGIGEHFYSAITETSRYCDHSWTNIWMHLSFLFGACPTYSFRTPMPDWSIGLEMQFYLAFPFLMLLFRRNRFWLSAGVIPAVCGVLNHYVIKDAFVMPSFLPLSINFFLIGMLAAVYNRFKGDRLKAPLAIAGAIVLALITQEILIIFLTLLVIALLTPNLTRKTLRPVANLLGNRFSAWLADMSYGAYLIHLAFMTPIAYFLTQSESYLHLQSSIRFLIVFTLTIVPTYSAATFLFHHIEKNGILWGKGLVEKFRVTGHMSL